MRRFPLRLRLAVFSAGGTSVVLIAVGLFVYTHTGSALLDAVDTGLRSRAEVLAADVRARGPEAVDLSPSLIESDEAFAQVADASGRVLQSSKIVAATALVPVSTASSLSGPRVFEEHVPGIDNMTRVLAVPVSTSSGRFIVSVGTSLQDRRDEMLQLAATLMIGGPLALFALSLAGWFVAGAALRPVERIRREAAAVSVSDPERRLPVPASGDELTRLGETLNEMLDRLQGSYERERAFVDSASHELRTPLGVLKAELELALSRPRTASELEAAIGRAAEETDRLVRLAEDLLVLARSNNGRLPLHRRPVDLSELVERSRVGFASRAANAGVEISVEVGGGVASLDPERVRQALDNLLDNALRHSVSGGTVLMRADRDGGAVVIAIEDEGLGFSDDMRDTAFEPFVETDGAGVGLGLAIVRAVARAHGGDASIENRDAGGARVTLRIPD